MADGWTGGGGWRVGRAKPLHALKLEELGDGAQDLEDADDAGDGELLIVEIGIDGDIAHDFRCAAFAEDLDGAEGVEYYGVDLAVLYVLDVALMEGDDVAVAYLWLHGVSGDVAPEGCFLESWHDDVACRYRCLGIEYLIKTSDEIYIVKWGALPCFKRYLWLFRWKIIFF